MTNRSDGHVLFLGEYEFFIRDDAAYKAIAVHPIMPDGFRHGRWECPIRLAYSRLGQIIDSYDLTVFLCATGNPDALAYLRHQKVLTLQDAARTVKDSVSEYGLDADQFVGGNVWATSSPGIDQKVAHILHSGRILIGKLEDNND